MRPFNRPFINALVLMKSIVPLIPDKKVNSRRLESYTKLKFYSNVFVCYENKMSQIFQHIQR